MWHKKIAYSARHWQCFNFLVFQFATVFSVDQILHQKRSLGPVSSAITEIFHYLLKIKQDALFGGYRVDGSFCAENCLSSFVLLLFVL